MHAALAGNALILFTRFDAAGITGSSVKLTQGIHSLVDTGSQFLLLYGLKQAAKPADQIEVIIDGINTKIEQQYPYIKRIFIEAEKTAKPRVTVEATS